jgi:hypothetical protein
MKKNIQLSFILLCVSLKIIGQTPYYKLLGDSTRWYVSGYILGVKPTGTNSGADIGGPCIGYYNAIKDSVYNGKTYKQFVKENSNFLPCLYLSTPPLNLVLIREDSLLKKVFIVHPDSVNECVAMDFSLSVGDSLYLPFATSSYALKNGYYKVDSIVAKNEIMGIRKHFYLSKYNAPINYVTNKKYFVEWIESIGATHFPINVIDEEQSMGGVISNVCKKNQYSSFVTCKFDKGIKHYQDSCALQYAQTHSDYVLFGNNCEYYGFSGGIRELSFLSQIELYPNPSSSEQLTLKFSASEFKTIDVVIYNLMGQKVYSEELKISTTENIIHFYNLKLNQGIYNLQIKSAKESATIKFIRN